MYALTSMLINGTPVSPGSHPILVSLLELAAQPPGIDKAIFPDATSYESFRKRVRRAWDEVAAALKAAVIAGITDQQIVDACPHEGLSFSQEHGWKLKPFEPDTYRKRVASLIEKASGVDLGSTLGPEELKAVLRAFNRSIGAERALRNKLKSVGYVVYASGISSHIKALVDTRNQIRKDNKL